MCVNSFAMEEPSFKDVFNRSIYDLENVDTKTPVEEIAKKLSAAKILCVKAKKTGEWEKQLERDRNYNAIRHNTKYICYGATCVAAVVAAWWFWPAAATWGNIFKTVGRATLTTVYIGGHISLVINHIIGEEIDKKDIDKLNHQVNFWINGSQNEAIQACEIDYLTKKYNSYVPKALQQQIEKVLIVARDQSSLTFAAEDFVRTALALPIECKALQCLPCPTAFAHFDSTIKLSLERIMADIVRCSQVACRPHSPDMRMRHIHIFVGTPIDVDVARKIAMAYSLPFHKFMPDSEALHHIYGSSLTHEFPTKGELIKVFAQQDDENFHNSVIEIDFDYLCDICTRPTALMRKIVKSDSFHNNYFDIDIDLRKLHVFISTSGKNPSRTEQLQALAEDLQIDCLDFRGLQ